MRSKSVPWLTPSGLALLCLTIPAGAAAPRRPAFPHYDIVQLCDLGIGGTRGRVLRDMCIQPEREALADMRRRWAAIPARTLSSCIDQQASLEKTYGGAGSYQGLRTCVDRPVQAVDEVPPTEQRISPAARPTGGPGETSPSARGPGTRGTTGR